MKTIIYAAVAACVLLPAAATARSGDTARLEFSGYIAPRSAEDWRRIANALIEGGHMDEAARSFERVLELAPGDEEALAFLAAHDEAHSGAEGGEADRAQTMPIEPVLTH